jgi:hypothetical protein
MQFAKANREFYPWLYEEFSKALNFKIFETNKVDVNEITTFIFGFYFKFYSPQTNTHIVHIEQRKLFIPPGELYGDYEKMFLPFDSLTWTAIGVLVLFVTSAILAMKLMPLSFQNLMFGRNTRSPLLNFISILINGSQDGTMIENAPRIVFATFLFWSMIFR